MKIVFLIDPIESLSLSKDTSYALMNAAHQLNHTVSYCYESDIRIIDGTLQIKVKTGAPTNDPHDPFKITSIEDVTADALDILVIRTDPPFDKQYLAVTWLLDTVRDSVKIINSPTGIRNCNEKLSTLQFQSLIPQTTIVWSPSEALSCLETHSHVIAKPIDGHGGKGVFNIKKTDSNARVIFETLSENGEYPFIIQPFINEAIEGDKRIIINNGKILGAILRKQEGIDHRHNFFAGGTALPYTLNERDTNIVTAILPKLKEEQLHFVGIDLLGPYLTEINVTSPTCLVEMSTLLNRDLAKEVIQSWALI